VHHDCFDEPGAEEDLWGPDRLDIAVPRYTLVPEVPEEGFPAPCRRPALNGEEERSLFLRYNYAKYRLSKVLENTALRRSPEGRRQVQLWRGRAQEVRSQIVSANLPLVPSMAKRVKNFGVEFSEMISEGYMALLRSVEKFDVSRGFKFSTYACRAILACFHRMATKSRTLRKYFPAQFDPELERSDYSDRRHEQQRRDAIHSVREVFRHNQADLSDLELDILHRRFPVFSSERRQTLSQVGQTVGLSNERVRQIEKTALLKLRIALEEVHVG